MILYIQLKGSGDFTGENQLGKLLRKGKGSPDHKNQELKQHHDRRPEEQWIDQA